MSQNEVYGRGEVRDAMLRLAGELAVPAAMAGFHEDEIEAAAAGRDGAEYTPAATTLSIDSGARKKIYSIVARH